MCVCESQSCVYIGSSRLAVFVPAPREPSIAKGKFCCPSACVCIWVLDAVVGACVRLLCEHQVWCWNALFRFVPYFDF